MEHAKVKNVQQPISAEGTQTYIVQMLEELSAMAQKAGRKDLGLLLRATVMASKVDLDEKA